MNAQEIEEFKENGRRKLFRVRFPSIYGTSSQGFVVRTLLRGEIFRAFCKAGYPEREIPKGKLYARCSIENDLFPLCVLDVPKGFTLFRAHACVVTTVVNEALRRSGFVDGSEEQTDLIRLGARYANSVEGRTDAMILHLFPSIRPYDLEQMTYEEWSMRSMQAVLLGKAVIGKSISNFLSPDPEVLAVFDPSYDVQDEVAVQPATMQLPPENPRPAPKTAAPPEGRTDAKKAELLRQLGMAPKISAQSIGLNQKGDPNVAIEKGETRMFVAGERYDVDKLRSKIRQDSGE